MPSEKKIIVTVDPKGNPKIEAQGFSDGACLKETASLEDVLGKVTERTKKVEAFKGSEAGIKVGN